MRLLPHSLWLLIAAHLEAAQAQQQLPTAIKKMPPDQSEKFHPHYVAFGESSNSNDSPALPHMGFISVEQQLSPDAEINPVLAARCLADEQDLQLLSTNSSVPLSYRPPFANHNHRLQTPSGEERAWNLFRGSHEALARLQRRQWNCPEGTTSCSRIGYPNSCCRTSETCVEIEDVGLGKVGCCPAGATCGGSVSTCADGNTGCASEIGGGCCLPGFVCAGVGCIKAGSSPSSILAAPTTSSASTAIIPPVRPTSSSTTSSSSSPSSTITTAPTSSSLTSSLDYCPTGFYACLASAGGGCCQTGRDCSVTNCPPIELSTIINSNGHTIAVPITAVPTTTATGTCASGWFLCGKEAGPQPGCCPSGYACGSVSCSVVITPTGSDGELATATEAKARPTYTKQPAAPMVEAAGMKREVVGVEVIVGVAIVVGMIV